MTQAHYVSPLGLITLAGDDRRLCRVILGGADRAAEGRRRAVCPALGRYVQMLERYFGGEPIRCEPGLLALDGRGPFARGVYEALLGVPFGSVVTYGELAELCGCRAAARAVGQVLSANPLPIFVPCHRVVRADGSLGGFSAGIAWKRGLLRHEGRCV